MTVVGGLHPLGIYVQGLTDGSILAMQAIGLILVYRSGRVVNFAQLQMGTVAGQLFWAAIARRQFILWTRQVCSACVPLQDHLVYNGHPVVFTQSFIDQINSDPQLSDRIAVLEAPGWFIQLDYFLCLLACVAVGIALALVISFIMRFFAQAPRLVVTVATIGAGSFAVAASNEIVSRFLGSDNRVPRVPLGDFGPQPSRTVTIDPIVFHTADVVGPIVLVLAAVGIAVFLRRTSVGLSMRAVSDNADRAQTLGFSVGRATTVAWTLAGLLSGLASIIGVMRDGAEPSGGQSLAYLEIALAAVAIAGLTSIPFAVVGCLVLSVVRELVLIRFDTEEVNAGILLVVLLAVLLLKRQGRRRGDSDSEGSWTASRQIRPTPPELEALPQVRRAGVAIGIVIAVVILGLPFLLSAGQLTLATFTLASGIIALSVLVLSGWAGQISLGQVALAAIGGYFALIVGLPMPLALIAGAIAGAIAATLIGLPALRLRGLYLAIVTLAFAVAVSSLLLDPNHLGSHLPTSVTRPALLGIDFDDDRSFYYLVLATVAVATAGVVGLRRGRTARALIACKDNEASAQAFGMSLLRVRLSAFAIAGFLAALAGGLQVYALRSMQPNEFSPDAGIEIFLVSVLGGLGALSGPFIGVAYVYVRGLLLATPFAELVNILLSPGLGVLLILLLAPGGLAQMASDLRDAWLRRLAVRYHIDAPTLLGNRRADELIPLAPVSPDSAEGQALGERWYRPEHQWMVDRRPEPIAEAVR